MENFNEAYFKKHYPDVAYAYNFYGRLYSGILSKYLNKKIVGRWGRALDIGCGYGYVADLLLKEGFEVYGIDVSPYSIKVAQKCLKGKAFLVVGDMQKLVPFRIKFNLITAFEVLEHLRNPQSAIENIREHLEDGGLFLASTPNPKAKLPFRNPFADSTHINVKGSAEWMKIFKICDFSDVKIELFDFVPLIWRWTKRIHFIYFLKGFSRTILISAMK